MNKNLFYVIVTTIFLVGCNSETVNGSIGSDSGPTVSKVVEVEHSIETLERLEKSEGITSVKIDDNGPSFN